MIIETLDVRYNIFKPYYYHLPQFDVFIFFLNYVTNVRNCYLLKKITHENSSKLRVISYSL